MCGPHRFLVVRWSTDGKVGHVYRVLREEIVQALSVHLLALLLFASGGALACGTAYGDGNKRDGQECERNKRARRDPVDLCMVGSPTGPSYRSTISPEQRSRRPLALHGPCVQLASSLQTRCGL